MKTFQDKELTLTLQNNITGGISSVMGEGDVVSDDVKKLFYVDADNLCGWVMSESLPYDEIKIDENVDIEEILIAFDESDIGYFFKVDIKYRYKTKDKTKYFLSYQEKKIVHPNKFTS